MKRREFLFSAAAALPATFCVTRLAAGAVPAAAPRFLLVFLRGGYDCANLLIPYSSSFYYESRPHIAIPRPAASIAKSAVALDADWALAPAVRESIGSLYAAGQAAFIPFAGTEDVSRSHFETQDSIELGQAVNSARNYQSGLLSRLAAQITGSAPIAFTDALPLSFRGAEDVPNLSLKSVGKPVFDARQSALLAGMYAGSPLESAVKDGLELRQEVAATMADEMRDANRGAVNTKGFALEAERIGRLMREQYQLGFVDVGGWDTHVNEGAADGALAGNLANLGEGLRVFAGSMGSAWKSTVVVVLSEFGRTFHENGSGGTDHGHGSVYWVLGGGIRGGRIAGEQARVDAASLFQNRDYPVLNDYRALLGGIFRRMWSLTPAGLERVFPGARAADLGLV